MSNKISLEEFQNKFANKLKDNSKDSRDILRAFSETVREGLEKEGKVRLSSFGYLELSRSDERTGRDPQTGEPIIIPSKIRVGFTPGKKLAESVNKAYAHLEPKELEDTPDGPSTISYQHRFLRSKCMQTYKPRKPEPDYREINFRVPLAMILAMLLIAIFMQNVLEEPINANKTELSQENFKPNGSQDVSEESDLIYPEQSPERYIQDTPYTRHRVQEGETLWSISDDYYETPYWWPVLYTENQFQIPHPDIIRAQMMLLVPEITSQDDYNSMIAQSYFEIYKKYRDTEAEASLDFLYAAYVFDSEVVKQNEALIPNNHLSKALARR